MEPDFAVPWVLLVVMMNPVHGVQMQFHIALEAPSAHLPFRIAEIRTRPLIPGAGMQDLNVFPAECFQERGTKSVIRPDALQMPFGQ